MARLTRRRRPNHRLVKINRNYTVEEAASVLDVHKNTVRQWLKNGLEGLDHRRPTLILGRELRRYLEARRASAKRPCAHGEMYCVGCRSPKRPAGGMADYLPHTTNSGNLQGICPDCEAMMYRRVSLATLGAVCAELAVTLAQAQRSLEECT